MSEDVWAELTRKAYESLVAREQRHSAVIGRMMRDAHDDWWAKQTRWFKVKYRIHTWFVKHRDNLRYRVANAIYPYPQDDEW